MPPSHKSRTLQALVHKYIDRIPTQITYTKKMGEILSTHFGVHLGELDAFLDNHMIRVDIAYERVRSKDKLIVFDWWGVGFNDEEEGYLPSISPLAVNKDLEAYNWPDPNTESLLNTADQIIQADKGEHFIVPNFGFVLFERGWTLRGFENFLIDMVMDPFFVEELLERITEIQLVLINRFLNLGVNGGYFGDDYGAQTNMLISPNLWRTMIKPRLRRLFAPFREAGLPIIMHSDGNISEILDDLLEIGLTTLNPVQPEVIDHTWLMNTYGDRLSYYGGISTQAVLPHGSPDEVKNSIADCIHRLAPEKTGLLIAPSHRLMSDIPIRNVEALLEGFEKYGK